MAASFVCQFARAVTGPCDNGPSIVVGITHPQTSLVLAPHLRSLRRSGFRVTLVSSPGERVERAASAAEIDFAAIPMRRRIAPLADLVSLFRLWRLLRRLRPDMAEFSTPKAGLLGMIAAVLAGVPRRVYVLRGLKLETSRGLKRFVLTAAERLACACAHTVLANSASLRERAVDPGIVPARRISVLGKGSSNGVDLERFSPGPSSIRSRLGIAPGAPVIGFVGRLTRDKGIPELIDAFDAIVAAEPEARLLLVGWFDDSEDAIPSTLRERIECNPRIHCAGYAPDTAPYYRAMDVLVLPTWREGFPNVVLEAQACGVPVVTTTATGSRDSVAPGVTGLLISPGDPSAIAAWVLDLLRHPARRRQMGAAAREWVQEHYAEERVLRLKEEFYRRLLETRATPLATVQNM